MLELLLSFVSSLSLDAILLEVSFIFVDFFLLSLALALLSRPTFSFSLGFLPLGDSFLDISASVIFLAFWSSSFSFFPFFLSSLLLSFLDSGFSFSFLSSSLVSSLTFRFSSQRKKSLLKASLNSHNGNLVQTYGLYLSTHMKCSFRKCFNPLVFNWLKTDADFYQVSAIKEMPVTCHHIFSSWKQVMTEDKANMQDY